MFQPLTRWISRLGLPAACCLIFGQAQTVCAQRPPALPSVVQHVSSANERIEMVINSSRILSLNEQIPKAQVNNPDILSAVPLAGNQIQITAKQPGFTTVNLWTESDQIYTVEVRVTPDARELEFLLKKEFPSATIEVVPLSQAVLIKGFVDHPEHASQILEIAEDYYPKVLSSITVAGVQQVLLKIKVLEVSRTKLRTAGIDWADVTAGGDYVASTVSGLLSRTAGGAVTTAPLTGVGSATATFGVLDPNNQFFMVLEFLERDNLAKIVANPAITAVSGRPANFTAGGEVPIPASAGLGSTSVRFRPYGTTVDFVPIVLGNGMIRLEVRPEVSEIDPTVNVGGIPGFRTRRVDTGVELRFGQTLAIAGLVQERLEFEQRGLPVLKDIPGLGMFFRRSQELRNEIEMLVLVTPELIEGVDSNLLPDGGPGQNSCSPSTYQFYIKGHKEVPCCPNCHSAECSCPSGIRTDGNHGVPGMIGDDATGLPPGAVRVHPDEYMPQEYAPHGSQVPSRTRRITGPRRMPSTQYTPSVGSRMQSPGGPSLR